MAFNNGWTPLPWLLLDADLAWTGARFANGGRILNAVDRVVALAASLRDLGPWSASLQKRYLGAGALVEDNSVRSIPSITANLRISRSLQPLLGKDSVLTLDAFNLFNRPVNDNQYRCGSQPRGLAVADDHHVHPAEPRPVRLTLRVRPLIGRAARGDLHAERARSSKAGFKGSTGKLCAASGQGSAPTPAAP